MRSIRSFPHYKQVRAFCLRPEPFSIENGMLTANGKLKRDLISARMKSEIEDMYRGEAGGHRVTVGRIRAGSNSRASDFVGG